MQTTTNTLYNDSIGILDRIYLHSKGIYEINTDYDSNGILRTVIVNYDLRVKYLVKIDIINGEIVAKYYLVDLLNMALKPITYKQFINTISYGGK